MSAATLPAPQAPPAAPRVLPYHRLYRAQPDYRWWRPLVAVAVAAGAILVTNVSLTLMLLPTLVAEHGVEALADPSLLARAAQLDTGAPLNLLILLGSIALWSPCVLLGLMAAGIRPIGLVHSVEGRIRWRWLLACLWPAAVVVAVSVLGGSVAVPVLLGERLDAPSTPPVTLLLSLLVIVLVVPLQSAAEEYVFRGLLMQTLGSWIAFPLVALIVPTALFTFGHLYDVWGLIDVAVFGLVSAWLAWRTGGLEAGIALHTMNNVILMSLLATGVLGGTAVGTETGGPLALLPNLVMEAAYVLLVLWQGKRMRLATTALAPALPAPPAPGPHPGPAGGPA